LLSIKHPSEKLCALSSSFWPLSRPFLPWLNV
jgi:hypothetical protein